MSENLPVIAILGGTGDLGTGLARCWGEAGFPVIIGSRTAEKANAAVASMKKILEERGISEINLRSDENLRAAEGADIVAITVPFNHQQSTLEHVRPALKGKILIDATVPLVPPKVARVQLPKSGSAGQMAQELLGEDVRVVSAFQNVAAHHLQKGTNAGCDVLVSGNNKDARSQVIELIEACGMRGFHAGSIANAAAAEALTSILIFINKQYKCHAGISLTGLDSEQ
jgi:NADPH-dependent F420 reductase